MKSLKNPNFDFLSSRVKRVKSCRFAKAKPIAFISVVVTVASVDREFKINLPRRLGRRKDEKFAFFRHHRDIRYGQAFRKAHCELLTCLQMNVFIDYSSVKHVIF